MRQERFVDGPQGRLWVSTSGDPAADTLLPVVLLHSDLGTLHHWDEIRADLDARHSTVAFDRRGHGRSDAPRDGAHSAEAGATDLLAVADALGLQRFALIGHSGGSLTAWSFAVQHGGRVAGLLLVDPPPDPLTFPAEVIERTLTAMRGPAYRDVAEGYYRSIAGTNAAVVARIVADARATSQQTLVGVFEALRDFAPRRLAGAYAGPMLSVVQPQYAGEGALHRIPPGWPHVEIPNTGHWIHLDAPQPFLRVTNDFVAKLG
jgi:pimeloyl-ACP methyl ester carboxylesterase